MLYPALLLLFHTPGEAVKLLIYVVVVSILKTVKKIVVYIGQSRSFKLFVKYSVAVVDILYRPGRKLCGYRIGFSWIALYKCLLYDFFRIATVIYVGGIEIIEACLHISVYHIADTGNINFSVLFRKSHKSEAKLRHFCNVNAHFVHSFTGYRLLKYSINKSRCPA